MEEKKGILGGALGRMILPGIILQSVLIGGGYATGREIVEYGAKFGAMGWLSGLATFVGFALVAILSFELIRLYKVYDFKSFLKELIGPCTMSLIWCTCFSWSSSLPSCLLPPARWWSR